MAAVGRAGALLALPAGRAVSVWGWTRGPGAAEGKGITAGKVDSGHPASSPWTCRSAAVRPTDSEDWPDPLVSTNKAIRFIAALRPGSRPGLEPTALGATRPETNGAAWPQTSVLVAARDSDALA